MSIINSVLRHSHVHLQTATIVCRNGEGYENVHYRNGKTIFKCFRMSSHLRRL